MGNVMQTIIVPGQAAWGPLDREDTELAIDIYERVLGGYDDAILDRAFADVAATWEPRYRQPWPVAATIKLACDRALKLTPAAPTAPAAPWVEPDAASKARVQAMVNECVANLKTFANKAKTDEAPVWKGRTYFGVTREDFEGRYSTVLGCRWHSPTLAEVIAKQDAEKQGTDE